MPPPPPKDTDNIKGGVIPKGFTFWIIIGVSILMAFVVFVKFAFAHGPAQWIQDGKYKNTNGELCCGIRDCFELADVDVKVTSGGYYIVSIKETVPFADATPSPDGKYWRCQWGGARKCFFAPPANT